MANDMRDKDIMYEPLLDDKNVETLMDEDDFEFYMGSSNGLQGVEEEDPAV